MNVLSIRGGGIRGIIPALILARLEAETGKSCRELFGLIVGTSTGGILALGLALGIRADQMARLYSVRGPLIFRRRWRSYFGVFGAKYDLANLREAVYGAFRDAPLFDCSPVMVTATEVCTRKSVFLKSWRTEHMAIRCVDAGCATGAAPTYFDPVEIAGVGLCADGGLFANNPASFALTEARKLAGTEEIRVVDVGCGDPERHGARHRHWGAFQYATSLADLFLESGQDAAAHQCEMALGDGYLRVMPELGAASMAMDDTSAANLQALQAAGVSAGTRFAAAVGAGVKV